MSHPFLLTAESEPTIIIKVRPEENDGVKLYAAMNYFEDVSDIVQLLGTIEGP
jgi:hypothetical protein